MRIGIFSDVHANWEALSACLKDFEQEGLNKLFFIGDVVGYGADPNLTVQKVSDICDIKLLGNHDAAVIDILSLEYFNDFAQEAIGYTQGILTKENKIILKSFEIAAEWQDLTLVHSTPVEPESWGYIMSLYEAEESFSYFTTRICMIGHTHRPVIIEKDKNNHLTIHKPTSLQIDPNSRYIINVGSVGQPRDGNPEACYLIYDPDNKEIRYKRIKYDINSAQNKMKQAKIPDFLVNRLSTGK